MHHPDLKEHDRDPGLQRAGLRGAEKRKYLVNKGCPAVQMIQNELKMWMLDPKP